MVWRPDLTVAAIVERDKRFLLVEERIRGQLVLNQPAGHVEAGESLLQAAVRETLEETAWQFHPTAWLGAYQWQRTNGGSTLRFAIVGTVDGFDAQRPLDPPVQSTHWVTREDMQQRAAQLRSPLVLRCVDDYFAGVRLPLDALHTVP